MLLYGAAGHGKVIIDCLLSQGEEVLAIFDDDDEKRTFMGLEVINFYSGIYHPEEKIIVAVINNTIRKTIAARLEHQFGVAVHDSAIISQRAFFDEGTVVLHNAVVQSGTNIGKHVVVNVGAVVDHDCTIQDYVHIGPCVIVTNNVLIEAGAYIGAGAIIMPGVKIGAWSVIGAGMVVDKDVPGGMKMRKASGHTVKT